MPQETDKNQHPLAGYRKKVAITLDTELDEVPRGIMLETTGDINAQLVDDEAVGVIPNVMGGMAHPLQVVKIATASTTATGTIWALY